MPIPNTPDQDVSWADMPHLRKVGRYLLFGICAFSTGGMVYVLCRFLGFQRDIASTANTLTAIVVFFALREMSKQWDWVLEKRAEAREQVRSHLTKEKNDGK